MKSPVELVQNHWRVHDAINALARELRPSMHGAYNADAFLTRIEALPGYNDYVKVAAKFLEWTATQRTKVLAQSCPAALARFVSYFPDSTGMRQVPALDLPIVEQYFRQNHVEFARELGL